MEAQYRLEQFGDDDVQLQPSDSISNVGLDPQTLPSLFVGPQLQTLLSVGQVLLGLGAALHHKQRLKQQPGTLNSRSRQKRSERRTR